MPTYPLPYASNDLSGQVALVTGATSGLGWRFARTLAAAGAKVAIAGRRRDKLAELEELITGAGGQCLSIEMEMTDAEALVRGVDAVVQTFGKIDILVNNAGMPDAQRATKMSVDLVDRVIGTNLRGPFLLACEVARHMMKQGTAGRIVNISSAAAFHYPGDGAALYAITKGAVVRMTEALAVEWAKFNINVNAIAPGVFHSDMMAGMIERVGDFSQTLPRGKICDPALLDSSLLFLCSPASECVTGTVIRADDGQFPR